MKIIYLYPKSSFVSSYDSDFLFGYLLTILKYLHGLDYTNSIIRDFENNNPPFLLSSCFYFLNENNHKTLFLPKPLVNTELKDITELEDYANLKHSKKQKFITLEKLAELLKDVSSNLNNLTISDTKEIRIRKSSIPHSRIDRITNTTTEDSFYHTEEYFIEDGGLFFLYEGDLKIVEPALNFINHFGIGADSSTGKGHFKIEISDIELPQVDNPNCFINLSSYYPTKDELDFYKKNTDNLHYELDQKEGKIGNDSYATKLFKKRLVNFFAPGSVFPIIPNHKFYGCIKEVAKIDQVSIKFNGYSLVLKFRM